MIEALAVTFVLLSKAGRLISTNPSPATLWRWALNGINGIILRTYKIGGRRYTTAEDLEEFVVRLNESRSGGISQPTTRELERQAVAAEQATAIFGAMPTSNDPPRKRVGGKGRVRQQRKGD